MENYHVTYEDIANVFTKIKSKRILNKTIILNGQAEYKTGRIIRKKSNKNTKRKGKNNSYKVVKFTRK